MDVERSRRPLSPDHLKNAKWTLLQILSWSVGFCFLPFYRYFVESSHPDVIQHLLQDPVIRAHTTLNCFTGEIHHEYETDGKKCNSTSTLTVHAYGKNSTASCIIRHRGLQGRKLVAPFRFEDLGKNHQWLSLIILNLPYITLKTR